MKNFLKITIIILMLAMSFLTEPRSLHAYQINNDGYIENIQKETGIFVLNNFLGEEVRPIKNETQPNISSNSSLVSSFEENQNFLNKNDFKQHKNLSHNLLSNLKDINQIRAP